MKCDRKLRVVAHKGVVKGVIQMLPVRNADGGGGCQIFRKKRYEGVMFNVISVTRGWVGVQFPGK